MQSSAQFFDRIQLKQWIHLKKIYKMIRNAFGNSKRKSFTYEKL